MARVDSAVRVVGGRAAGSAGAVERCVAWLGRGPAAVGQGLDAVAERGPWGVRQAVRMLSSVRLGLVWLGCIGLYVAAGSGFAGLRARLEMTDLEFFDAWPMVTLLVLMSATLAVVTLRRIPLTIFKLGPWLVHGGILTLVAGCFVYFAGKQEGSVRVFLGQTVEGYYDGVERALYFRKVDLPQISPRAQSWEGKRSEGGVMVRLAGLPIYHEHLAGLGNGLDREVDVTGLGVAGLRARVTGYYPYAELVERWRGDDGNHEETKTRRDTKRDEWNPAVRVRVGIGGEGGVTAERWLVGKSPAGRVLDSGAGAPVGVEYLWHPTPEQWAAVTTGFAGAQALTVRVPKLGVERTYLVEEGKEIAVAGTPYKLVPRGTVMMPLRSAGYEGVMGTILLVDVARAEADGGEYTFQRQVVFRFPERSPDFVTEGGRPRRVQERVDAEIELVYHDATRPQVWIVEDGDGRMRMVARAGVEAAGGKVTVRELAVGEMAGVAVGGTELQIGVVEKTARAVRVREPMIVPLRQRERTATVAETIANSVVELELSRGEEGREGWRETVYVPFVQFGEVQGVEEGGRGRTVVEVPGAAFEVVFSTTRRELPVAVTLRGFEAVKYPGAVRSFADYVSTLEIKDRRTGRVREAVVRLNQPAEAGRLSFFQAAWDGDENAPPERRFTVLGVGNRPGIGAMLTGAVLMVVGIGYAFYVKPVLVRWRREQLNRQDNKAPRDIN